MLLKRPVSSQFSWIENRRLTTLLAAHVFVPARFVFSTHTEQLSASFHSARQIESYKRQSRFHPFGASNFGAFSDRLDLWRPTGHSSLSQRTLIRAPTCRVARA